jgi:thioredoxin-like negative regulator of GroEL
MTLCCIGGVCIPYSALVPVAVWCLQWLVEKLGLKSYIPDSWWNLLQPNSKKQKQKKCLTTEQKSSCCSTAASTPDSSVHDASKADGLVRSIDSEDEWEALVLASKSESESGKGDGVVVIAKFTATWCKPCHAIQPVLEGLAAAAADKNVVFGTIDVDEVDSVASDLKIGVLPTVVVVVDGTVVDRYTGSHAGQLQDFCSRHTQ